MRRKLDTLFHNEAQFKHKIKTGAALLDVNAAPAGLIVRDDYCLRLVQILRPINVDVEATTASLSFWHGNANIRRSNSTLGATDKHSCRITCMITHRSGLKLTVGRSAVSVYFNGTRVVGA